MAVPPPEIVRFLADAVARRPSAVLGLAAIEGGRIAWTATAGAAHGDDTAFQAGSLSKSMTSAVALVLVERGELDLDGGLGERLVSWRPPAEAGNTTLRDLLGHTAGANVPFYPGYEQGGPVPTLVQSLDGTAPATTPAVEIDPSIRGRFRYSGGGFTIVQQLIEDVTGMSFADAARELVLGPLGMSSSTFLQSGERPRAAHTDWRLYPESAAAGLWTTPSDLARFVCSLHRAEAMTTPHVRLPYRGQWRVLSLLGLEPPRDHGLGLFLRGPRFLNLGGSAGFFSALTGSTENGAGAVVMTAGCRPPLALRLLFELSDVQGWSGVRVPRRSVRRLTSGVLMRLFS